jgi:hypothetical protein
VWLVESLFLPRPLRKFRYRLAFLLLGEQAFSRMIRAEKKISENTNKCNCKDCFQYNKGVYSTLYNIMSGDGF